MKQIIKQKQAQLLAQGYIRFTRSEIASLNETDVREIQDTFQGRALMMLPEGEIDFFEWLKEMDLTVWEDLWGGDDEPYRVSTDFLHHFVGEGNGFPICDLVDSENYWFSVRHIKPKAQELMEVISRKLDNHESLDVQELLLVEIMTASIDIWHFCHRNHIDLDTAKEAVAELQKADMLVHLTDRDDLVKYLDV